MPLHAVADSDPAPDPQSVEAAEAAITTLKRTMAEFQAKTGEVERLADTSQKSYEAKRRAAALSNGPMPRRDEIEQTAALLLEHRERLLGLADALVDLERERQAALGRQWEARRAANVAEILRRRAAAPALQAAAAAAKQAAYENERLIQELQIWNNSSHP